MSVIYQYLSIVMNLTTGPITGQNLMILKYFTNIAEAHLMMYVIQCLIKPLPVAQLWHSRASLTSNTVLTQLGSSAHRAQKRSTYIMPPWCVTMIEKVLTKVLRRCVC